MNTKNDKKEDFYSPYNAARLRATYEPYFSTVRLVNFKPESISLSNDADEQQFFAEMRKINRQLQNTTFSLLMKMEWADRKIMYAGQKRSDFAGKKMSPVYASALKAIYDQYVGFSRRFWNNTFLKEIRGYADDIFPDFDNRDGFAEDFAYPYEFITVEGLFFVARLPDRMRLIEEGERRKLTLGEFYDFGAQYCTEQYIQTGKNYKIFFKTAEWSVPYINEQLTFVERMKRKREKSK